MGGEWVDQRGGLWDESWDAPLRRFQGAAEWAEEWSGRQRRKRTVCWLLRTFLEGPRRKRSGHLIEAARRSGELTTGFRSLMS